MSAEDEKHGNHIPRESLQLTASLLCELPFKSAENSSHNTHKASISDHNSPWITVHGAKSAILVNDRTQVKLVDVSEPEEARNATQKVIQTAKEVQAMTFSGCGEFLAVADATGTLSLYKSDGTLLFGHRIMREDSDSVVSIKFATSEGKKSSSDAQELVVVTRLGLLLRIGGLRLTALEKMVLEKPKEALSEILRTIRFNRTNVGRLQTTAQSCVLTHHFQSECFVLLGNHGAFLSVWKSNDTEIEKVAGNDSRSTYVEAMDFDANYSALVVLCEGKLSWWNWRDMTELKEAAVSGIMSFAVVGARGESEANSTSLLVVARAAEDANATPSFQLVEISHDDSGDANTVAVLDWTDSVYRDVALFARIGGSSHCQALAACRIEGGVTMVLLTGDHSITDDIIGSEGEESVGEDAVTMAESLVDISISSLTHKGRMKRYQTKLDACTRCIGDSEEDSRVILKILLAVAARIRKYTSSSPKLPSRMASLLHWCDKISDLSYKWTTFQLLRSSSTRDTLREKWRRFRSRGVTELLEKYMKLGNMRAVRLLWSRHVDDATVHSIGKLLEGLPASLPVSAYANWLQNEVLPLLIHQAQSQATETGTESLLDQVALWLLKRAEDTAATRDLDSAMRICSLLKPEDTTMQLELQTSSRSTNTDVQQPNVFKRMEHLREKLRHVKYLSVEHQFDISLPVFEDETPATIAMSMLDRVCDAALLKNAMEKHVRKYLGFCGVKVDSVLHDYVTELAESVQTAQSTEELRALVLLEEISDINVRADATLTLLRSSLPPYSDALKRYAHNATQWKTERREELQEHVRLMEIQEMLTKYGMTQFDIADTKSASRLVSHVLNQVSRPTAFVDAMLLVDAYSDLRCDRAVVRFTENLFADGLVDDVSVRVTKAMGALKEIKKRREVTSNVMLYVSLLEEIVEYGVMLLELEADERSEALEDAEVKPSIILGLLKALVAVYLPELKTLLEVASATEDDAVKAYVDSSDYLLCDTLLTDLQRIARIETEFHLLLSISTLRDPEKCETKLKQFIKPEILFAQDEEREDTRELTDQVTYVGKGKGKKRAVALNGSVSNKRQRTREGIECQRTSPGLQRDDERTRLLFDLNRFASVVGVHAKVCRSLLAQSAATNGSILQAVRFSRGLFSTGVNTDVDSVEALQKTAISLSLYTSSYVKDLYDTSFPRRQVSPAQRARAQAPMYTLELLRYALCMCEKESFDETLILFKKTMLVHDILQYTQHNMANDRALWTLYPRWYRGDACVLPSNEAMKLVTRFAIAEHKNLRREGEHRDTIASKRYVSYLVEQRADLLSLQALLSMQELPEDAAMVVNTQMGKLLSTVFQSPEIDNYLALGLMLSMRQEDAFHAFRRQISRENVAKDFHRFQKLAFVGADAARAWQQIAFLHQCVELEGNARWWHYLSLLGIECDHKAFQSERRDLEYIRGLVPQLIARSNFDFYTILEFTRHYQIDDSYPSLVYTEALLLSECATLNLEYQDQIVGVVDDIHEQHLSKLLRKSLPKISGLDYDRLLFIFRLLLEKTSYREREEVTRRVQVLRTLKVFTASQKTEGIDMKVSFHELLSKPRKVLSRLVNSENFNALIGLVEPLRLQPDELQMMLLKSMIAKVKANTEDGTKFRAFEDILVCLSAENRVTMAEWIAENLPLGEDKLEALEFARKAAVSGSEDACNTSFTGYEAQKRLETKMLRVKVEMLLRNSTSETSSVAEVIADKDQTSQLLALVSEPTKLFQELYRRYALSFYSHNSDTLHTVASSIGELLQLPQDDIRLDLIRDWLVEDALHIGKEDSSAGTPEDPFELVKDEKLRQTDEEFGTRIIYLTSASVKAGDAFGDQVLSHLVDFAKDSRPRAGVTFRAKMRALRVILRLTQVSHAAVEAFVCTKYGVDSIDTFLKEILRHTKLYTHMMAFEEHRVPYDMSHLLQSDKETLARSFLMRFPPNQPWVLRCASQLMLDFDVAALDVWDEVLTSMLQLGMVRSLATILEPLSKKPFVRSLNCGRHVWEEVLTSPMTYLKHKKRQDIHNAKDEMGTVRFVGIPIRNVRSVLARVVTLLQSCPFLDQIDVSAFVIHLRDLNVMAEKEPDGADIARQLGMDDFAVKCALVIPSPLSRFETLVRMIHAEAYNSVLHELLDSCFLDGESTIEEENGEVADTSRLIQECFSEAARRKDYLSILNTPMEPDFVEYLAATADIDYLLSLLLEEKRMETALTAVQLYYEYHPTAVPSFEDMEPAREKTDTDNKRWALIEAYLVSSRSILLERFREAPNK